MFLFAAALLAGKLVQKGPGGISLRMLFLACMYLYSWTDGPRGIRAFGYNERFGKFFISVVWLVVNFFFADVAKYRRFRLWFHLLQDAHLDGWKTDGQAFHWTCLRATASLL